MLIKETMPTFGKDVAVIPSECAGRKYDHSIGPYSSHWMAHTSTTSTDGILAYTNSWI